MLGKKYTVPSFDGDLDVKIPSGATPGELLRIRGKGAPKGGGQRGDLLIKVNVTLPKKLSRKARKLVEELQSFKGNTECRNAELVRKCPKC